MLFSVTRVRWVVSAFDNIRFQIFSVNFYNYIRPYSHLLNGTEATVSVFCHQLTLIPWFREKFFLEVYYCTWGMPGRGPPSHALPRAPEILKTALLLSGDCLSTLQSEVWKLCFCTMVTQLHHFQLHIQLRWKKLMRMLKNWLHWLSMMNINGWYVAIWKSLQ